jgi:hypothetical protein
MGPTFVDNSHCQGHQVASKKRSLRTKAITSVVGFSIGFGLIAAPPANAYIDDLVSVSQSILGLFGIKIPSQYTAALDLAIDSYNAVFSGDLDGILDAAIAVDGALGYPILGEPLGAVVDQADAIWNAPVILLPNGADVESALQGEVDKASADAQMELIYGEDAQADAKESIEDSAEVAFSAIDDSDQAQLETVSQKILKTITRQNSALAVIQQSTYSAIVQNQHSEGLGQYAMTKLAYNADKEAWSKEIDRSNQNYSEVMINSGVFAAP